MQVRIYTIYDKASKQYQNPWFQPSDVAAVRAFGNEVNRPDPANLAYQNPEDFSLHFIGVYDTETGTLIREEPMLLAQAVKLVKTIKE